MPYDFPFQLDALGMPGQIYRTGASVEVNADFLLLINAVHCCGDLTRNLR